MHVSSTDLSPALTALQSKSAGRCLGTKSQTAIMADETTPLLTQPLNGFHRQSDAAVSQTWTTFLRAAQELKSRHDSAHNALLDATGLEASPPSENVSRGIETVDERLCVSKTLGQPDTKGQQAVGVKEVEANSPVTPRSLLSQGSPANDQVRRCPRMVGATSETSSEGADERASTRAMCSQSLAQKSPQKPFGPHMYLPPPTDEVDGCETQQFVADEEAIERTEKVGGIRRLGRKVVAHFDDLKSWAICLLLLGVFAWFIIRVILLQQRCPGGTEWPDKCRG